MTHVPQRRLYAVGSEPATTPVEAELIARAVAGDAGAWTRLYQDNFQTLYTDVLYLVHVPAIAEELTQESFAAALVALSRFDGARPFRTWLRGVAHNLVRHHWRKHSRRARAYQRFGDTVSAGAGPTTLERQHLDERRADVLEEVLAELSPSYREVFVLRDVQGLTVEEVAERLEISPGNVRVRANRARARIRAELTRLGWITEAPQ